MLSADAIVALPGREGTESEVWLATQYKVCQVNIDNNPGLAGRFQVNAVPTLLVFRGGRVVKRIEGAVPEAHLRAELRAADRA